MEGGKLKENQIDFFFTILPPEKAKQMGIVTEDNEIAHTMADFSADLAAQPTHDEMQARNLALKREIEALKIKNASLESKNQIMRSTLQ